MVFTTYDLSEITDALVAQLTTAVSSTAPIWGSNPGQVPYFQINVTGNSPETMRTSMTGECQLNLYLMHVGQDPFFRNSPIFGSAAVTNVQQPLALDLAYLLTAYATDNASREQQAMSIALRFFHEQPIYISADQYLTITLGTDKLDEMSRLWQSFTVAYRLSTVFRVAVALMTPTQTPDVLYNPPTTMGLAVAPVLEPLDVTPRLFDQSRRIDFTPPPAGSTDPGQVVATAELLSAFAGQTITVGGVGLAAVTDVFLTTLNGATTWTITSWRTGGGDSELVLQLPAQYAIGAAPPVPASTPTPGVYLLSVAASGAASGGPAIPIVVVPLFTGVTVPPLLPNAGGTYTINGAGFVPGATQVYLGDVLLTAISASPAGTTIGFSLPPGLASGLTTVRVRVDGVDAPPTWQLMAP